MSTLALTELATLLLGLLVALAVARRCPNPVAERLHQSMAAGLWLPATCGAVTMATCAIIWPGLPSPVPVVHDEAAYLFQAELFASLRWIALAPPRSEFFEQFHLLVEPTYASKYPPGHSLLLTPGMWLGVPALVPLLLSGLTAATLVSLVRRLTGPGAALLAWLIWLGTSLNLRWRPTYFSELTTGLLILVAWYALHRWREHRSIAWLGGLAVAIGWGAITRPLTTLVFALPIGAIVLLDCGRLRLGRQLLVALSVGIAVLLILPFWAWRTTGDWAEWPVARYTADYQPFDRPGFGLPDKSPVRTPPLPMQRVFAEYEARHATHSTEGYWTELRARIQAVRAATWSGWRKWLLPVSLAGIIVLGGASVVALTSASLHFLAYGLYAHPREWTLYYLELAPIGALFTGVGLAWIAARGLREDATLPAASRTTLFALGFIPAVWWFGVAEVRRWREYHRARAELVTGVDRAIGALPDSRLLVFVRYDVDYIPHDPVIRNHPDLDRQHTWMVHDLGAANASLMRAAPDRKAYLLEIPSLTVTPFPAVEP